MQVVKEEPSTNSDKCPFCEKAMQDVQELVELRGRKAHKLCAKEAIDHLETKYGKYGPPRNRADKRLYRRDPLKYIKQGGARVVGKNNRKRTR